MKAKELMIGDWVRVYEENDDPMECGYVTCRVENLNDFGDIGANCNDYKEEDVEPIPLTVDILSKNGFIEDGFGDFCEEDRDALLEITSRDGDIRWTINCDEYDILEFKFVHQLQHALKLCGIEKDIEL